MWVTSPTATSPTDDLTDKKNFSEEIIDQFLELFDLSVK
jgi:hypothetical protein